MRHIRVAVAVPGLEGLSYRVPEEFPAPARGSRVLVPLGQRIVTGIVVDAGPTGDIDESCAASSRIKNIIDLLDREAFLPADVVALTMWVAEYYACGPGDAVAAAMPPRAWIESERYARLTDAGRARLLLERGSRRELLEALDGDTPVRVAALVGHRRGGHGALSTLEKEGLLTVSRPLSGRASGFRTARVATITAQGLDVHTSLETGGAVAASSRSRSLKSDDGTRVALGARQIEALGLLAGSPGGIDTSDLAERGISSAALKRLAAIGLISFGSRRVERDPFGHAAAAAPSRAGPVSLTDEQHAALTRLSALASAGTFAAALLHGVTGSGKTELYLRLAQQVSSSGRGVVVLVPEIALTPAIAGSFRALFGDRVAIQHSGLADGERHDQWHRIRRGEVDVVVGTRSAVFAPIGSLGLIIVDEEHDSSYKQEESPRYHGRDVAVMRARMGNALVVLGSATPSVETYHNAERGRYALISLRKRVFGRPMAEVRLVDMREEYAEKGPDVIISGPLVEAIRLRLERREQAVVLLNRRGFATTVFCRQCGNAFECPNCSLTLTVHRATQRASCHYCNYSIKVPTRCAHCAGPYLEHTGFGTERVEAELCTLFPEARVARVDRDTVRRRGAITTLLQRFADGGIDVLVGTQMIAKGHDFPQVTLVGVVSADIGLGLADFRAGERTFQLMTQVAGRAGRGAIAGEAIVQTIHPNHYSIRHACQQDYRAFYDHEVRFRRSMRYPPAVGLINAVVKARTSGQAMADATELVQALRSRGESHRVLGPAPAPIHRLKGEHRVQLFLKGMHRGTMRKALLAVLDARPEIKRRTVVDVDPVNVL